MPDGTDRNLDRAVRARSVWSGTISFGLVSIPVSLFPANRSSRVSLRMLDDDGTPLARRYYDPETGDEVSRDEIVRGYEIEKDEYVVVTEEELEAVEPEKTRDIDLRRFVPAEDLDPTFFERAYFLAPDGESTKAYRLLAAVMEDTGRAGIATFVMRTKEYLIAILAENGILRAETLRFHDEIRGVDQIDLPDRPSVPKARVKAMRKAIGAATEEGLDQSELEDRYAERVLELVEAKRDEGQVRTAPAAAREPDEDGDVIDLMEVLKRSLQRGEAEARTPKRAASGDGGAGDDGGDRRAGGAEGGAGGAGAGGRRRQSVSPDGAGTAEALRELTKAELYERAQAMDIPGRSSMKKDELVEAIRRSA